MFGWNFEIKGSDLSINIGNDSNPDICYLIERMIKLDSKHIKDHLRRHRIKQKILRERERTDNIKLGKK